MDTSSSCDVTKNAINVIAAKESSRGLNNDIGFQNFIVPADFNWHASPDAKTAFTSWSDGHYEKLGYCLLRGVNETDVQFVWCPFCKVVNYDPIGRWFHHKPKCAMANMKLEHLVMLAGLDPDFSRLFSPNFAKYPELDLQHQ
jgi:hypothetical protein